MIQMPNMLILGSANRNVGKTEFACELIRRHAGRHVVVAVKITTVREPDGCCPRGGEGCGVCGSLRGDYCLTEEMDTAAGKDTARIKEAGAQRVFWLRVLRDHLREGIEELLRRIPAEACVVCESNSARLVLDPGAFLVIRDAGTTPTKESCAAVLEQADRILLFHGDHWDMPPDRCRFTAGRWLVPMEASAAVLAGGQSRRMGCDKSLLPIRGRPLLEHILEQIRPLVDETVIGANDPHKYEFAGVPVIADEQPSEGPLMGILSVMQAARHERVLVTACDIPELPASFLRMMLRKANHADIVMPRDAQGRCEPLPAVYTRRIIGAARAVLARGGRRIVEVLDEPGIRAGFVDLPHGGGFRNLNTPEDYRRLVDPECL